MKQIDDLRNISLEIHKLMEKAVAIEKSIIDFSKVKDKVSLEINKDKEQFEIEGNDFVWDGDQVHISLNIRDINNFTFIHFMDVSYKNIFEILVG